MKNKKIVDIYTDGACSGNPGMGGWASVLIYKEHQKQISGNEKETTNNRMELLAVINAFKILKESCEVNLFSDSNYVINAFKFNWIKKWEQNNWKKKKENENESENIFYDTESKNNVKNKDLWIELMELSKKHKINWIKVEAHKDNELNNLCDKLAKEEIKLLKQSIDQGKE